MKKKFLALLLAALMVVSLLPTVAFAATAGSGTKDNPWQIGKENAADVTAWLSADGKTLTIEGKGTGAMMDFGHSGSPSEAPWVNDGENNITTVVIGSGVTRIGNSAFEDCDKVANLYIDSIGSWCGITLGSVTSTPFSSSAVDSSKQKLFVGNTETTDLVIPVGVTTVPAYAFLYWEMLTSVEMPSVTSIGQSAFFSCKNLTSVDMPSVTSIGDHAFSDCRGLTSVDMPSVTSIMTSAFNNCFGLTSVDIGSTYSESLGLTFPNCNKLKSVVIRTATPPKMLSAFDNCNALTEIIVPAASETAYKESSWWSSYASIIKGAYYVNVADAANGTVTASPAYVAAADYVADSETITLTVTPDEGYQLKEGTLKVNDGAITLTGNTFKMPAANVTVTAEFEEAPVHTHSFTYTANNGKLTATCTAGCDKGYDTTPLTLTLTAPASLVYDGNAKAFTFADGEADAWTGAGLELPTIFYNIKQSGQSTYMPLLGTLKSVGNYMAEITVNEKTAQVEFAIGKATPYIKTNPEPTDIVYGKKLSDSTLVGGYVQVSSTNTTQVGGLFEWKLGDTIPALSDSETTEYDVTFTPTDTNNYNTVSCKVKIKVTHTHNPVLVNGQAATETAAGWSDYYECKDSTDACHKYFEDATAKVEIIDLDAWKAQGGNGYIAPLVHNITPVNGKNATDTEAGYNPYYECKNCGKYYEDATGLIEISNIDGWKAEGGAGYLAPLHGTDNDHNHICDYCDRTVSNHIDADNNHICDICSKTISNHIDTEPKDHICDICGKAISNHADDNKDHICDICGKTISNHVDTDPKDHVCDYCGKTISNHTDTNTDHICDYCGETISNHADTNKDHKCDYCGKIITNHVDEDGNKDHLCDICGDVISNHEDTNKDHVCDICGKTISNHTDADPKDHICDYCGKTINNHADEDKDHVCDYCEKAISNHEDTDKDHICEYCGKVISNHNGVLVEGTAATLESAGFKSYYKCDCGKFFEDATCKVEITDLDAWKAQGGNGYIAKLEEEPTSPQTGDTSNMTLLVMLMALSSMGLCACLVLGKKRKNEQ